MQNHKKKWLAALLAAGPMMAQGAEPSVATSNEEELPTVEVRGVRTLQPGRSEINSTEIERLQADNIQQLLDTLPGVDMAGSNRPGGQTLNIWGFGDVEDVKVVLDGAPKGFEKYRQGSIFIEPELLKRVVVDKGPHNLRYGNGGFGGVVTVDTKDASDLLRPGESMGALVRLGYHSNDNQALGAVSMFAGGADQPVDLLASVTQRDSGNQHRADGVAYPFSATHSESGLFKMTGKLGEHRLTLSAVVNRSDGWTPFDAKRGDIPAPTEADIAKYGLDEAWRRKVVYRDQDDETYSATWRFAPAANPLVNVTARYADSSSRQHDKRPDSAGKYFTATMGNESWTRYHDQLAELSNEAAFDTGPVEHKLLVGSQWHRQQRDTWMNSRQYETPVKKSSDCRKSPGNDCYNYGRMQPYYMPSGTQTTLSGYLQDALSFGALTVTPGVRYDKVTSTGVPNAARLYNDPLAGHDYGEVVRSGWSSQLGLHWQATQALGLFADYGETWRAPLVDELYEVQSWRTSAPMSSNALLVERIKGWRGGAMLNLHGLLSERDTLSGTLTVFRNRVSDNIHKRFGVMAEPGTTQPKMQSFYRNLPGYTTEGAELETYYDAPRAFASLALSWMRGDHTGSVRNPWGPNVSVIDIAPPKAVAVLGVKFPEAGVAVGWQGKFVRRQDRVPQAVEKEAVNYAFPASKGYGLHTLFASWQGRQGWLKNTSANLTVDNLFNREYTAYLSEGLYSPGRNVKVSVTQRF
ncbi:TonB-dependent hemoglobin/transferrin/lactoferrin family receptor [Neisseriaceae bacterium JH1-16]|nr:TonB-dependent hemoglobin/transferrin/lactoferrin family receptor [Neisseriaceae bacterium JH1-16]